MTQPDTEKFRLRRFRRAAGAAGRMRRPRPADRSDRRRRRARRQPEGDLVQRCRPGEGRAGRQRHGLAQAARAALDTDEAGFPAVLRERLAIRIKPIEVPSPQAPVQRGGADRRGRRSLHAARASAARRGRRALYLRRHRLHAGSARPASPIIGCRRIMLRGPRTAGIDLIAPSDLRAIYLGGGGEGREDCRSPLWSAATPPISWPRSHRRRRWTNSRCSARCAARRCRSSNA